jgi:hypothetical protein
VVTVAAGGRVNAANLQTYGLITLAPNLTAVPSQVSNIGGTPLFFNGGSRTFIGTPATASQLAAGIDLNGKNAVVAGGLLVNNGFVVDTAAGSPGRVIADYGALVKGAGFYQNPVITQNGGKFQAGNSPGAATFGSFAFGPGGVDRYVFSINDATGSAGPSPNAQGHVSGWGLVRAVAQQLGPVNTSGDFNWTADTAHKLTVALETLVDSTSAGADVPGPMPHFDPSRSYAWPAVRWAGEYDGPHDPAALTDSTAFDVSGFANPIGGVFGWSLDLGANTLSLTYTPVPEPGTVVLAGAAAVALAVRRWRKRSTITTGNR